MKCKLVEHYLVGYIEGELPSSLHSGLTEHFLKCSNCSSLLKAVKATYLIYERDTIPPISDYFYTHLEQKLIAKASKKSFFSVITPGVWQPIAASFVIVVGIFIGISIGKQISTTSSNNVNKNDALNIYATEYYLDGSGEESLDNLIKNE